MLSVTLHLGRGNSVNYLLTVSDMIGKMTGRDPEGLRAWLARKLKVDSISDGAWAYLEAGRFVEAAETESGRAALITLTKRLLKVDRPLKGYRARRAVGLPPYETDRATALTEAVAKTAAALPWVRQFRADLLGSRLLLDAEAWEFLTSPATRILEREEFLGYGIPFVGNMVTCLHVVATESTRDALGYVISPPGGTITLAIEPAGVSVEKVYPPGPGSPWPLSADVPTDERGGRHTVQYWARSLLHEILAAMGSVARHFLWDESAMLWFLLTGAPPPARPLIADLGVQSTSVLTSGTITLTVSPWIPAPLVLDAYRQAQRSLLGGDNRALKERNISIFRFVAQHVDERGEKPPWQQLLDEWNAAHPEWVYQDLRLFVRDYHSTEVAVMHPSYDWKALEEEGEGGGRTQQVPASVVS